MDYDLNPRVNEIQTQQSNMADNDVATRAPESDAQEASISPKPTEQGQSIFPGDTRAQEGPTMGVSMELPTPYLQAILICPGSLYHG